jgi:hypothetical protein
MYINQEHRSDNRKVVATSVLAWVLALGIYEIVEIFFMQRHLLGTQLPGTASKEMEERKVETNHTISPLILLTIPGRS